MVEPSREFEENYGIYKKFKPFYDKGWNDTEIAEELGCHNATVAQWRNRNNLPANTKKKRILDLYKEGFSKSEIVERGPSNYKYTMNVLSDLPDQNAHEYIDKIQKSRIIGTLLGDASINSRKTFTFSHKYESRNYCLYKANQIDLSHKISDRQAERWDKTHDYTVATFHAHPYFKKLRKIFYPDGDKIFPKEHIEDYFNWNSLAYWYLDDGNLSSSSSYVISIFAMSDQAEEIKGLIKDKFSIDVNIWKNGNKIYIPAKYKDKFTENIIEYVPECMMYKVRSK